ncbi:MAG TPA: tetratricopeptide repeat protein [Trueperaceae bacterium]|nr:tetratricopeptide repeat protein [Trueperaceae bacterium]
MIFRRHRGPDLESAHKALALGQYDVALAMLENAAKRAARQGQGQSWLLLAELYALYGEEGLENGQPALRSAVGIDPNLASHPLYRALFWEFAAYRGGSLGDVKRGLKDLAEDADAVAAYHAGSALFAVDAPKSAAKRLLAVDEDDLPVYLRWRRWSLLGQCREAMGEWEGAAESFTRAIELAPPPEREPERLSLAGALIELGRTVEAVQTLESIDDMLLRDDELSVHRYLLGRAHLELGNPNQALELLAEARAGTELEDDEEGGAYSVVFATAQALSALGRSQQALIEFERALELAPAEQRAYTQHEAAYTMIECDKLLQAEALLAEVVSDPSYSHRADALADLADIRLRNGEFEAAHVVAEQALELGATAPACLTLGNIAYEYYRLDEAASWFEQTISASQAGDPYWVSAQQMLADVFAQLGDDHAEQLLRHARAALEHTDASSEWHLPLTRYLEQAKRVLGEFDRLLN